MKSIKREYENDGFFILGIFGSFARGEETPQSDTDILFDVFNDFRNKYHGCDYFRRIIDIKEDIEKKNAKKCGSCFCRQVK